MRRTRWTAAAATLAAAAMAATACGGGGDAGGSAEDATLTINGTAPENPLVPGNTSEAGGGKIIDHMYTGLIGYNPETGEPYNEHAEKSTLAKDGKSITYKLKKGWTFHDGTEIKAKNYVDTWNYVAYTPNGQELGSFFTGVKGYKDVTSADPKKKPKKKKMSGVTAVDDYTLKVQFDEAMPAFERKVGYSAFKPLPDSFFKDPEAFEKKPVGSGPFKFIDQSANAATFEAYDKWKGKKPSVQKVEIQFGTPEAAYDSIRDNNLDFLENLPPKALVDNIWEQDLQDRAGPSDNYSIQILAFPLYQKKYQSADFRHAISMAIDREEITKTIYNDTRKPLNGYGVPDLPLWEDGACGEFCKHNPDEAKKLFEKSGWKGPIEITSNADGGHKEWIEAVCGQIKKTLGEECKFVPVQEFGVIREQANNQKLKQIYRSGWGSDYPHVENFLNPLYRTGGSSNDNKFSDKKVDAQLEKADAEVDDKKAAEEYHKAEELVAKDMPAIPLWSNPYIAGWSERLENIKVSKITGELDWTEVKINPDAA